MIYGHDVVLPMEVQVRSLRVAMQNGLTLDDYSKAMMIELEGLDEQRLVALYRLQVQKVKVARAYNKKIKTKTFHVGERVWKTILLVGSKDPKFGCKW